LAKEERLRVRVSALTSSKNSKWVEAIQKGRQAKSKSRHVTLEELNSGDYPRNVMKQMNYLDCTSER